MTAYRVYLIGKKDHISLPSKVIECAVDREAIDKARGFVDGHDVEVRELNRLVIRISRKEVAS
jgi:hypothetical protein